MTDFQHKTITTVTEQYAAVYEYGDYQFVAIVDANGGSISLASGATDDTRAKLTISLDQLAALNAFVAQIIDARDDIPSGDQPPVDEPPVDEPAPAE